MQEWPESGVSSLAPELVFRTTSRSEPALAADTEDTPTSDNTDTTQNVTHSLRCGPGRDMRQECLAVKRGNPARAPPLTG
jgi:hypothetical protein